MTISVTLSRTCGASALAALVLAALPTLAQARDDAPVTDDGVDAMEVAVDEGWVWLPIAKATDGCLQVFLVWADLSG